MNLCQARKSIKLTLDLSDEEGDNQSSDGEGSDAEFEQDSDERIVGEQQEEGSSSADDDDEDNNNSDDDDDDDDDDESVEDDNGSDLESDGNFCLFTI